jgi:hypothetical protein
MVHTTCKTARQGEYHSRNPKPVSEKKLLVALIRNLRRRIRSARPNRDIGGKHTRHAGSCNVRAAQARFLLKGVGLTIVRVDGKQL